MLLTTAEESLAIDFLATRELKAGSPSFMDRAGAEIADLLIQNKTIRLDQKIAILCGPGNNGGDAFVVARELWEKKFTGLKVYYFKTTDKSELWHDQFSQLFVAGVEPIKIEKIADLDLAEADIIIDGLFGVGLKRLLEKPWIEIIEKINQSQAFKISIDIPSGLHANRGVAFPVSVRANLTIACELFKPGMLLQEGPEWVGHLKKVNIGFPKKIVLKEAKTVRLLTQKIIPKLFPTRSRQTNKSKQGHLLVIAGSPGMTGALKLCAEAASKLGVGYVTACSRAKKTEMAKLPADFLTLSLADFFKSDLSKYSAVVVGPGLGQGSHLDKILEYLRNQTMQPVVVDADALTDLAKSRKFPLPGNWLVTPHAGELSRLLDIPSQVLEENRLDAVYKAHQLLGCHILFKGFRTIVFNSKVKYIIGTGNAALAKAGTGDVLAGFIGSLLAQGLATDEAAALGSLIHGHLADKWVREGRGNFSLMASDLIEIADIVKTPGA